MIGGNKMNEATFEARVHKAIESIFPNFSRLEITHQVIFTVKLGHENVEVKPTIKKPRLDILIKYKGRNLAVLELKKPTISLTDDDRKQGLSYARLLEQMPPLVIVSNGNETLFYETISGEPLVIVNPEIEQLEKLFTQAIEIAAVKKDEAIQILLGKDPLIWEQVIDDFNEKSINNHIGSVDTLYQPISDSLHLPRKSTEQLIDYVGNNNPVIALTGAPLIGKTNVLYEFCYLKDTPFVPIYINAEDCQYGIFQYLANHFTKHFFSATSTDEVRQWFLNGIVGNPHISGKTVLIVDGVRHFDDKIINDVNELIQFSSFSKTFSLVIGCDSSNYNLMAQTPGRPGKTLFGKKALKVEVNHLTEVEFENARDYLTEHWSIDFQNGAKYSRELRIPRIIRIILSQLPSVRKDDTRLVISSFLPYDALNSVLQGFSSDIRFIDDMVKLVNASMSQDLKSPLEVMVSYGRGFVPFEKAESILGENRIERLLQQGHIDWFVDKEQNRYIAPKTPELFAASAVEALFRKVNKMENDEAIEYVLNICESLPYSDLIAANVFERLSSEDKFSLYELIVRLANNPPRIENIENDFNGALYFDHTGLVNIPKELLSNSPEEGEGKTISNLFPWLVLSQLATKPLFTEGYEDPWYIYREILKTVGSYQNILRRYDPIAHPENVMGYLTHTLLDKNGEEGEVLCGEVGIIEPITYAMMAGFSTLPDELLEICKYAVKENDPFLNHRLYNAASSLIGVTDEKIENTIKQAFRILKNKH